MDILFYIIITLLIFSIIKATIAIMSIKRSLDLYRKKRKNLLIPEADLPHIIVVICVLREQKILKETVNYFLNIIYPQEKLHLLLVTTERELSEAPPYKMSKTTIEIVNKLISDHPKIKWLHYPQTDGLKSDQINHAVEKFKSIFPDLDPAQTFYALYDADSRPHKNILMIFNEVYHDNRTANVFQQSATYLKNFFEFDTKRFFTKYFLKAQALKQTRFIFAYEIPRILRVYKFCSQKSRGFFDMATYAPCISHGLFVRVSLLKKIPFPEKYTPEDMFWGFLVSNFQEPIVFIPSLDVSETPDSIKKVFYQLARWFQGPFLGFRYKKFLKNYYNEIYNKNKIRAHLISFFSIMDGLNWLLTSTVLYVYIYMIFLFGWPVFILVMLFIILYQYGNLLLINELLPKNAVTFPKKLTIFLFGIIVMLFHSIPAYFSLWNIISYKNIQVKTER